MRGEVPSRHPQRNEGEYSHAMFKSAWGSDDPTKAAFPFLHAHALAETDRIITE